MRTWRSPVCTSSCSSSLLLTGWGGRGLGEVSTKYPRRTFTLTKSHDESVLFSPALRRLCQRGPCVCVWRQWWSWVSGERWRGARLVRCSEVNLSVWLTQCSFFSVRSLIFAYRRFTSCSLGSGRGACFNLFFPSSNTHSFLFWLFLQLPPPESTRAYSSSVLLDTTLLASQYGGYPMSLSQTHKQTHAPTLDLVVRLLLCSTQHHLWMFYAHWRLPWRCGLIGPSEGGGGEGGGEEEERQKAHKESEKEEEEAEEEERNKGELRGKCPPMNQQWQYIMSLAHHV